DDWMRKYYEISGKSLRVCEYNVEGNDGSWPDPKLLPITQKQRADYYEWYATSCQKSPYLVGQGFWFLYRDGLNQNRGLVDLWDEPYAPLVNRMAEGNSRAIEIHENASFSPRAKGLIDTSFLLDRTLLYSNVYKRMLDSAFTVDRETPHSTEYKKLDFGSEIQDYPDYHSWDNTGNGKTHYVGGSGPSNYTKIQDAINNASNG
ncbi:unnamed protein product, partial [marine sediment metagenome]